MRRPGWLALAGLLTAPAQAGERLQELTAARASTDARFGEAVAVAGDLALVGAPRDPALAAPGAAHVFRARGGAWFEEARIAANDATPHDGFGRAVATDGERLVVGAPHAAGSSVAAGAAYVFVRVRDAWVEEARLAPSDGADGDGFGSALAIEGGRIVVGAPLRDASGSPDAGAVYVFERRAGSWTAAPAIVASDLAAFDRFGAALALDEGRLAVGAPGNDDHGGLAGAAYVLERSGAAWTERAKLHASDASALDRFGTSLDMSRGRLAAGAPMAASSGAVYVFEPAGGGWSQVARLEPVNPRAASAFGVSVAIDGPVLVAGAPYFDGAANASGAAFLFHRGLGGWDFVEELRPRGGVAEDLFGWSVALASWNGFVGAPRSDAALADGGAAYAGRVPLPPVGHSYCFGDGSASPCPCANRGGFGRGCANSAGAGARLMALAGTSVSADELRVVLEFLPPHRPALLFAGANAVNGGDGAPFGDGLRCAAGAVRRFGVRFADASGCADWGPPLTARFAPGEIARFQGWYRDPNGGPCGTGFNLSQGVELAFEP